MIAVADASPLIALSRIGCLELLGQIWRPVIIPSEVYDEVVIAGAERPGRTRWRPRNGFSHNQFGDRTELAAETATTNLGAGEVAVVWLARELGIEVALIDERRRGATHNKTA